MVAMAEVLLDDLEHDFVVLGTGLAESVLAASLAFSGARVLHLDGNAFYGAESATLALPELQALLVGDEVPRAAVPDEAPLPAGALSHIVPARPFRKAVFPRGFTLLPAAGELDADTARGVHVDLAPRTLLCAGPMVELLAATRVGHYLGFRALDAAFLQFPEHGLRRVPASRPDVFRDRFLTMPEKRLLMRFLKTAAPVTPQSAPPAADPPTAGDALSSSSDGVADQSFADAMHEAGLPGKLQALLQHAVALHPGDAEETPCAEAADAIALYQRSLARFGTATPFLYADYGSGELAQAFCRLCAVRGGTYVLRRRAAGIVSVATAGGGRALDGVVTDYGERIRCRMLFASTGALPSLLVRGDVDPARKDGPLHWRAACVLDGSIVRGAGRAMVHVPRGAAGNDGAGVRLRQVNASAGVCPPEMCVLYAETVVDGGTADDLRAVLTRYVTMGAEIAETENEANAGGKPREELEAETSEEETSQAEMSQAEEKPRLLWGLMYARPSRTGSECGESVDGIDGVGLLGECGAEVDAQGAIEEARRWFEFAVGGKGFFEEDDEEEGAGAEEKCEDGNGQGGEDERGEAAVN